MKFARYKTNILYNVEVASPTNSVNPLLRLIINYNTTIYIRNKYYVLSSSSYSVKGTPWAEGDANLSSVRIDNTWVYMVANIRHI